MIEELLIVLVVSLLVLKPNDFEKILFYLGKTIKKVSLYKSYIMQNLEINQINQKTLSSLNKRNNKLFNRNKNLQPFNVSPKKATIKKL